MAPKRSSVYKDESDSSDMSDDSTYEEPSFKRQKTSANLPKVDNLQEGVRKRGRRPSKNPCVTSNAQKARINREKKKQYQEHMEMQIQKFEAEIQHYKELIERKTIGEKRLEAEVAYFRGLMAETRIEPLLKSINESLQKNKTGPTHTPSSQREKVTQGKEAISSAELCNGQGTLMENLGTEPLSLGQLFPELPVIEPFDLLTELEQPLESLDSQMNATSEIMEDNKTEPETFAGICLHINSSGVSVEFCSACHQRSSLHS